MFDPYVDIKVKEEFFIEPNYAGFILRAKFSIGAGTYGVEWLIVEDKSYKTVITNDLKIIGDDFIPLTNSSSERN
ncbi:MAG: hypothetical protein J7604_13715 [Sporocytophaga sp.]|uniref:hypothetical protein n=1 Tax=Sporocytophaga sp. TaxID=2231183 RepID=UPI001B24C7E3|nr:hypothetical protein [Sporocytophaga sp.]MBO9701261.1 hypothetical protein [Sporocytophaga sp.]